MEGEGDNIMWFTFTGEEEIPDDATHVFVRARVIPASAFANHPNIIAVVCHEDVKQIKVYAFYHCPCLKRVIMPGVEVVEVNAFNFCEALMHVECDKLETIGYGSFRCCTSLSSIDLPSAAVVEGRAFCGCDLLRDANFSNKLERIEGLAFHECTSLERITIPLKDGMITADKGTFNECDNLKCVDLVDGGLHETIAALHLEEWRNDMNEKIHSINQSLPDDTVVRSFVLVPGDKANMIQRWISLVLRQITRYQAEHKLLLNEAATTLQLALPQDIVTNDVLTFLHLPSYSFE